jgi:hypothetical protein
MRAIGEDLAPRRHKQIAFVEEGSWPVVESTQLGSRMVAPIAPHATHRVLLRNTLVLAPSPKRAITSASLGWAFDKATG